ncbi:MAG TPA: hypothetical protein VN224_14840 [Xanthomonadales bacterium]|nr:hypothetical protein [Xanthomonadales bacterium]
MFPAAVFRRVFARSLVFRGFGGLRLTLLHELTEPVGRVASRRLGFGIPGFSGHRFLLKSKVELEWKTTGALL